MSQRRPLCLWLLSATVSFAAAGPAVPPKTAEARSNVLLVTVDTLRPDRLGCYGSGSVKTPAIDALAAKGEVFERSFALTSTTLPSHTNILLGVDPLRHGVHDNANFRVGRDFPTLAEFLKTEGYATAAFVGGFPLDSSFGLDRGFDVYDDETEGPVSRKQTDRERKAGAVVERAVAWIESQAPPWFAWVHCFDPHFPYEPPEPFRTEYAGRPYDGEVAYVDSALKGLLEAVDRKSGPGRTVVVFTGDHGESLGQHGEETHSFFAYNTTLWIPLIVAGPGMKPGRVGQTVVHTDIFPTVCELLGIAGPDTLQGRSLLPAANGARLPPRAFYFESLYPYYSRGWAPLYGYFTDTEKYIESPIPELYDLVKDFDEKENLAAGKDPKKCREKLALVMGKSSPLAGGSPGSRIDSQSLEKLRSLGYVSSPQTSRKAAFGPNDDVKVLLPFHNRSLAALALYEAGRKDKAVDELRGIIAERPDIDVAYSHLAQILEREGRLEEALEVLRTGADALPANLKILSTTVHFLTLAGRFDDAIAMITAGGRYPFQKFPESWIDLGVAYLNKGNLARSLEAFNEALALDPGNAVAHRHLGDLQIAVFSKTGDPRAYTKSLESYLKSLEIDPGDASAQNGLGQAYMEGKMPKEAIARFIRALEIRPDFPQALYNLGLAYYEARDYKTALFHLSAFRANYGHLLAASQGRRLDSLIRQCQALL
jgi:arylsulfatase A-like enzyme/tetratricopeptide (TPR) repeat protein